MAPSLALSQGSGGLSGRVLNEGTGVYLEGARVVLSPSGASAFTGRDGRFAFPQLPPGNYEITASYTGMDSASASVVVETGRVAIQNVSLSSEVYALGEYVVPGEREGSALALTLQRNAPNVKNVLSSDAFGNVADENIGNFLMRVPGIGVEEQEGQAFRIQVRGIDADYNAVTIDGTRGSNAGPRSGLSRGFEIDKIPADLIDAIEVTKAPTPDMDADSIGGAVNLRTKSALNRSGRHMTYSLGGSYNVDRSTYRPLGSIMYSDIVGADERLGIMLTASFNRSHKPRDQASIEWERTLDTDRPLFFYGQIMGEDQLKHTRGGAGLRLDYKLSDTSTVYFNTWHGIYKDGLNRNRHQFINTDFRVIAQYDAQGLPRAANINQSATVVPGWTDTVTETENLTFRYNQSHRDRRVQTTSYQFGGETEFMNSKLDYNANFSPSRGTVDRIGPLRHVPGVGIRFDRGIQHRRAIARWEQTSGPDVTDPANSILDNITVADDLERDKVWGVQANLRRDFALGAPSYLKMGVRYRGQDRSQKLNRSYYSLVGPDGVMGMNPLTGINDDNMAAFVNEGYDYQPFGLVPVLPYTHAPRLKDAITTSPELFQDDVVRNLRERLRDNRTAQEQIYATYLMAGTQLNRMSVLGGLRMEETNVKGRGTIQVLTPEEQARRAAWTGPVTVDEQLRRTEAEFGNPRTNTGKYRNVFPGVHFRYEILDGLLARASWSSGIGRPNFQTIIPNDTVNHTNELVTSNNAALRPQYSDNFDVSIEYYFEPAGLVSAGAFLKEITDFIFTATGGTIPEGVDNGFGGEFAGYTLRTQHNGGAARVRGIELAYQQQFSNLPGFWRGFGIYANHTWLESMGDYGSIGAERTHAELVNFVPRTANAGISYIDHGWTVRVQVNYTGDHLTNFNNSPARRRYQFSRKPIDLNVKYDWNRRLSFYVDVINVFDYPMQRSYYFNRSREFNNQQFTPMVKFGVNGRL